MSKSNHDLFNLEGKVAMVTGGTGYLGTAFCQTLAEAEATVVVTSRNQERANASAAKLTGANHLGVILNHKDQSSIESAIAIAIKTCGQLDILINNGTAGAADDWTTVTQEQFNDQLANATAYFLLSRLFSEHIVNRSAEGAIVNIGSMYGIVASYPDAYQDVCNYSPASYHALKGGVIHMTRHLAVYWAKDRIRVNCLSPGPFPSERAPAEMVERLCTKSPMERMGTPDELKGALLLLASNAGSYITGQNLVVDGGWTAW